MIKYILIPIFLFQIIQLSAQKSDWTDADRKRLNKLCEEKSAKEASKALADEMSNESPKLKETLIPMLSQLIPMACPCLEQEVVKKYPERRYLFSLNDEHLATLIASQLDACFDNLASDSTLKIGWSPEFREAFISVMAASFNEGAKGKIPEENCKNIATCFVDKLVVRYPNPFYPLMKMGESNDEETESDTDDEMTQMIYSCFGATPAEKK